MRIECYDDLTREDYNALPKNRIWLISRSYNSINVSITSGKRLMRLKIDRIKLRRRKRNVTPYSYQYPQYNNTIVSAIFCRSFVYRRQNQLFFLYGWNVTALHKALDGRFKCATKKLSPMDMVWMTYSNNAFILEKSIPIYSVSPFAMWIP